jgi:hypothetical protein
MKRRSRGRRRQAALGPTAADLHGVAKRGDGRRPAWKSKMAARTPNTGSRLRTSARVGSCLPITRSPPRAIQRIAPPWQSSWAFAARRAKLTEPVGVGGASIGETSRAQAEPTSDDLTGGGTRAEAAGAQAASIGCGVAEVQRSGHPGNRRGKTRPSWAAFSPPSISCIRRLETVFAPRGDPPGVRRQSF